MPVGEATLGRIMNVVGEPVDEKGPIPTQKRLPIHREAPAFTDQETQVQAFETGIKVVDLLAPVPARREDRPLRRRRRGQDGHHHGAHQQRRQAARRRVGVRRRGRAHARGQRPLPRDAGVEALRRQPGHLARGAGLRADERAARRARARGPQRRSPSRSTSATRRARTSSSSSTTSSASCRRTRRCRRCSAACRRPSATSPRWAPTSASCRSASPRRSAGSITSVQAIYVPADDLTDPAPATTFAHLDATTVLNRGDLREGHLPGGRPARLDVAHSRPEHRRRGALHGGAAGAGGAAALQGPAGHHRHPRHGRAVGGRQADRRARAQDRALPVAAVPRRRAVHGLQGRVRAARRDHPRLPRDRRGQARRSSRSRPSTWWAPSTTSSRRAPQAGGADGRLVAPARLHARARAASTGRCAR